jgi:hypothetical protein
MKDCVDCCGPSLTGLCSECDTVRKMTAASDDVGADALAKARREGAEAMREGLLRHLGMMPPDAMLTPRMVAKLVQDALAPTSTP